MVIIRVSIRHQATFSFNDSVSGSLHISLSSFPYAIIFHHSKTLYTHKNEPLIRMFDRLCESISMRVLHFCMCFHCIGNLHLWSTWHQRMRQRLTFANQVSFKHVESDNRGYLIIGITVMHFKYSGFPQTVFPSFPPQRPDPITWNTGLQGDIGICCHY